MGRWQEVPSWTVWRWLMWGHLSVWVLSVVSGVLEVRDTNHADAKSLAVALYLQSQSIIQPLQSNQGCALQLDSQYTCQ